MGAKTSHKNAKESTSVARGWGTILHHNAHPHIANALTKKLYDYGWEMLPHVPYSPDMNPLDFNLFPKLTLIVPSSNSVSPLKIPEQIGLYTPFIKIV